MLARRQILSAFAERIRSKCPAPNPASPARPRLEWLEVRNVPTALANQAFVTTLYQGLLNRPPDPAGLSIWSGQLDSGATPEQVASGFLASTEYRGREAAGLYPALLGRDADLGGVNAWVASLASGSTLDQVKAGILASDEFFSRVGGTTQGFLSALYQDVLGRNLDPLGQAFFTTAAGTGQTGRLQTALQVLASSEAQQIKISNDYQTILGRPVDTLGQSFWATAFSNGLRDEAVIASLFGSTEYFARLQNLANTGTDPATIANQFISSANLFQTSNLPSPANAATVFVPSVNAQVPIVNLVQSPAFGAITLPVGFDPTTPGGAMVGIFGPSGFITGDQLAAQQANSVDQSSTGATTGINDNIQPSELLTEEDLVLVPNGDTILTPFFTNDTIVSPFLPTALGAEVDFGGTDIAVSENGFDIGPSTASASLATGSGVPLSPVSSSTTTAQLALGPFLTGPF